MHLQQLEERAGGERERERERERGREGGREGGASATVRGQKKKQKRYLEELEELVGGDRVEHERHVRGQRRDAKNDYQQQPLRPFISLKRLGKNRGGGGIRKMEKKMGGICVLKEEQQHATLVLH
jgi:hypothetical protein